MVRRNLRTGEAKLAPAQGRRPRAAQVPLQLEHAVHPLAATTRSIFYAAGNYVFRSVKQGDDLKIISPEITRTKRGSATALAESPKNPDVLWAGTDDGALWVTRDGGKNWTNLSDKFKPPACPGRAGSPRIEASRFVDGPLLCRASTPIAPTTTSRIVFVTEDFGQTWKSLRGNLPTRLDARACARTCNNPDLLYLGTEFAAVRLDRPRRVVDKINNNLPTVAVHEFAQPTDGRRDRRRDARPQPVGARRDGAAADQAGPGQEPTCSRRPPSRAGSSISRMKACSRPARAFSSVKTRRDWRSSISFCRKRQPTSRSK